VSPSNPRVEDAKLAQRQAADPAGSVWVAANAGSGKTRVLVDRVARLLLSGAPPHAILCLTFTKAAAAEMRARLSRRLGSWTAMDDEALRADLADLAGDGIVVDAALEARARHLFAATIDAPGGMRVQTIHSFCESLLRRFPIEAGVGVSFAIADDNETGALLAEARDRMFADAAREPALGAALARLVLRADAKTLDDLFEALAIQRRHLRRLLAAHGGEPERAIADLAARLGVGETEDDASILDAFAAAIPVGDMQRAAQALAQGSRTDVERAATLAGLGHGAHAVGRGREWLAIFLTAKNAAMRADRNLATKAAIGADPGVLDLMRAEAARCMAVADHLRALALLQGSAAMIRLGARLVEHYEAAKRARDVLDYDDLVFRSQALLEREDAAWVRFRLDGGIDHILVDEAQDTSAEQWRIVDCLAGEFFAGAGARGDAPRTLFAVGDEKQSIFSFQGADRQAFGAAQLSFERLAREAGRSFRPVDLVYSFRSTPTVLQAVDMLFEMAAARAGVAAAATSHRAVRDGEPGLVELWPLVEPPPGGDDVAWDAPLDYVSEASPPALLARRIAATIQGWIDGGEAIWRDGAAVPIRPGDVMILVRRRNAFFVEMVRALKAAGVPVAGADRLVLADHVAIQDLVALARFALLPRDDYALACVLKSPLCGLDDDDLLALCPARGPGGLWKELRARAAERPSWKAAAGDLGDWLAAADYAPPYEFFARVLGPDGGRRRFLARLGAEAADPLDEFLALALAFERENTPSLQGFLRWFSRGGAEIKRDMELARDEVRVMTVHASKGLEAPVVFLPDTVSTPAGRHDPKLFWEDGATGAPLLLWPGGKDNDVELSRAAREHARARRLEEYRRLLYVATTRARDRLVVCGWVDRPLPAEEGVEDGEGTSQGPGGAENWHELLRVALCARLGDGVDEVDAPWGEGGMALRIGAPPPRAAVSAAIADAPPVSLPDWARRPALAEQRPSKPLSPSSFGAAQVPSGPISGEAALAARRGSLLHRLFELLPRLEPGARDDAALRLARHAMPELPEAEHAVLAREALGTIDAHPEFFGPGSRAEVPVVGLVGTTAVAGQVDRLVVAEDEVRILDFKSNRQPPARPEDAPQAYVAQLALYRALVAPLYPGRRVRCILVWTAGPTISEIAPEAMDAALAGL